MHVFLSGALLAASTMYKNFRPRDVQFFYELFSNWFTTSSQHIEKIQIVQVQRYLRQKARSESVTITKAHRETYTLSPEGVLHILKELTVPTPEILPSVFFFQLYFLESYGDFIVERAMKERKDFSDLLRSEIKHSLSPENLVANELKKIDASISLFEDRMESAMSCAQFVSKRKAQVPFEALVKEVQQQFPYEMNPVKPMSALILELPQEYQRIEIEDGMKRRAQCMWDPMIISLKGYRVAVLRSRK